MYIVFSEWIEKSQPNVKKKNHECKWSHHNIRKNHEENKTYEQSEFFYFPIGFDPTLKIAMCQCKADRRTKCAKKM